MQTGEQEKEKTQIVIHHAKSIKGKRYLCVRAPVTRRMMYRDEREKQHSPSSFFFPIFFFLNFYLDLLHIPQKFIEH